MKRILMVVLMLSVFSCFGQKKELSINSFYEDVNSKLITSQVLEFTDLPKNELYGRFNNWAGQFFRNYGEVTTSKTDNQITLNYISTSFIINMYVIAIIEFKDNRIRIRFYDDGNVYRPASSKYSVPTSSRSLWITSYFKDGIISYNPNPGSFNFKENQASGIIAYKKSFANLIENIKSALLEKDKIKSDDNW